MKEIIIQFDEENEEVKIRPSEKTSAIGLIKILIYCIDIILDEASKQTVIINKETEDEEEE